MERASSGPSAPWRSWRPTVFSLALLGSIAILVWAIDRTSNQRRELDTYLTLSSSVVVATLAQSIENVLGTGDGMQVEATVPPAAPLPAGERTDEYALTGNSRAAITRLLRESNTKTGLTFATLLDADGRVLMTMRTPASDSVASVAVHHAVRLTADRIGVLRVGMSAEPLLAAHRSSSRRTILLSLVAVGLAGIMAATALSGRRTLLLEALRARSLNKAVLTGMHDPVVVLDAEERVRLVNPAACRLFGVSSWAVVGRRCQDTPFGPIVRGLSGAGEERSTEIEIAGCTTSTVLASVSAIRDSRGGATGKALILRDLTDVKRLERERQTSHSLAAFGRFATTVAHEIRNPLNAIAVGVQRLALEGLRSEDGTGTARMLELIQTEVQRLDRIVTGFLDLARPPELRPRLGDLDALLDSMLPLLREGVHAGIDIDFEKGGARAANFDPMAMRQVVLNLVRNAVEAVGFRGHVHITTHQSPQEVEIAVMDDGPGIPIDQRDRIFDFGFTTKPTGYGIGMPLVQRLVTEMHGSVAIASSATGGALVRVTLPAAVAAGSAEGQRT